MRTECANILHFSGRQRPLLLSTYTHMATAVVDSAIGLLQASRPEKRRHRDLTESFCRLAEEIERLQTITSPEQLRSALVRVSKEFDPVSQPESARFIMAELYRKATEPGAAFRILQSIKWSSSSGLNHLMRLAYGFIDCRTPDFAVPVLNAARKHVGRETLDTSSSVLELTEAFLAAGCKDEALSCVEELGNTLPREPGALIRVAQCWMQLNRPDRARLAMRQVAGIRAAPVADPRERIHLAGLFMNCGFVSCARRQLAGCDNNARLTVALERMLALHSLQLGDFDRFELCVSRMKADPNVWPDYPYLATLSLLGRWKHDEVEPLLARAEQRGAQQLDIARSRALLNLHTGKAEQALVLLTKLLDNGTICGSETFRRHHLRFFRGLANRRAGHHDQALNDFSEAIGEIDMLRKSWALSTGIWVYHFERAVTLWACGRQDEAAKEAETGSACSREPSNACGVLKNLLQEEPEAGLASECLTSARRSIRPWFIVDTWLRLVAARLLARTGRRESAYRILRCLIAKDPHIYPPLRSECARTLDSSGNIDNPALASILAQALYPFENSCSPDRLFAEGALRGLNTPH